ncbi:MAG TPA: NAD(P)-binding domain-containing protein, partial [Actinomycetota bacterium]|nr:NAD(P)-binding domain-containing protein [Actinomycetota bacterium]
MDVAVIGAGTVGTAVAQLWERAGHRIVGISGRSETRRRASSYLPDTPFLEGAAAATAGELVVIGTPDDVIERTVQALATAAAVGPGTWVVHLSGSLGLDVLEPARGAGAGILAMHPLQTFPDVDSALEGLPGCAIAVTAEDEDGYCLGERLAGDLHGL